MRLALMVAASCVLIGALGVAVLASPGEEQPAAGAGGFEGSLRPDVATRDFTLSDENGKQVSLSDHKGRPLILTFLYSTCKDTCPLQANQIRGALDRLGDDAVPALAVSVDPANDTPERARRFLVQRRLSGRMRFLLGNESELKPIWDEYGIQPQGKGFDHSAYVLLLDGRGHQRIGWPSQHLTPEGLVHDIRLLQKEAGQRESASAAASARSVAAL